MLRALSQRAMVHLDHEGVVQFLAGAGFCAAVRGDGAARFVFAEGNGRAVEISASLEGVWVEYWAGDGDSPEFDRTLSEARAATMDACAWLAGGHGRAAEQSVGGGERAT